MISISTRLQKILSLVNGTVLADIGCDHAYVAVNSVLSGKVNKAYACDIAEGPLLHAKATVEKYHVEGQVILRLQNGIENLPQDVDSVVIAGMGALTVIDILEKGKSFVQNHCQFILSVHKDEDKLRAFLTENGYYINEEYIVLDDHHYYPILNCVYLNKEQILNEAEILYGKNVVMDADYHSFIYNEKTKLLHILDGMPEGKGETLRHRLEILEHIELDKHAS